MTTDPSDPENLVEPPQIRFLRRLVTTLTVVMIGGLLVVIPLLVIRLYGGMGSAGPDIPTDITLPSGTTAEAITFGTGYTAIFTDDQRILILDPQTGALRQEIMIKAD